VSSALLGRVAVWPPSALSLLFRAVSEVATPGDTKIGVRGAGSSLRSVVVCACGVWVLCIVSMGSCVVMNSVCVRVVWGIPFPSFASSSASQSIFGSVMSSSSLLERPSFWIACFSFALPPCRHCGDVVAAAAAAAATAAIAAATASSPAVFDSFS
jgi:hypothetical protein